MFETLKEILAKQFWFSIVMMAVVIGALQAGAGLCIWVERKVAAWIQDRYGPNRVGPFGILQSLADGLKLFFKEDVVPRNVEKPVFLLATCLAFIVAMVGFAVIPWAGDIRFPWMPPGQTVSTQVADLNVGVLYMLAVGSMGVYGIVLGGWASNNKYAFYGGMRATAQMLSYEVPLGLGVLCILLIHGDLRLGSIVADQAGNGVWNIFMQPVAFLLVLTSAFAETNRTPFDLAEAEQELVGGYHTEYNSMKFGLFFLGEYAHMMTNSALMVALFFGGWAPLPFFSWISTGADGSAADSWWNTGFVAALIKFGVYWGKIAAFILLYMVVRWTIPRFRFDQLMRLAWKGMIPIGVAAVLLTSLIAAMGWQRNLVANVAVNLLLICGILVVVGRARSPITGRQAGLRTVEMPL